MVQERRGSSSYSTERLNAPLGGELFKHTTQRTEIDEKKSSFHPYPELILQSLIQTFAGRSAANHCKRVLGSFFCFLLEAS